MIWLALATIGCTGKQADTGCPLVNWWLDGDGDGFGGASGKLTCERPSGYVEASGDCDDGDPAVNPLGEELCNGVNDDCDWGTDEEPADGRRVYRDRDGDGYGKPDSWQLVCEDRAGFSRDARDCDDGDEGVHPAAEEVCDNGVDDDCDGFVDDEDPEHAWHADADGDGLGDPESVVLACSAPEGYVAGDDDCLDTDAEAWAPAWYPDEDEDGHGAGEAVLACSAPAGHVEDGDDCDDCDAAIHPSADEACDGIDNDCDGADGCTLADGESTAGEPGEGLGAALAGGGFLAAAGAGEEVLLLSAPGDPWDRLALGEAAWLALGDLDGDGLEDLVAGLASGGLRLARGPLSSGSAVVALANEGPAVDLGRGVLLAGDPRWDLDRGRVVLRSGAAGSEIGRLEGEARGDRAGEAVLLADLDGDGDEELVVGAPEAGLGGAVYLWAGPPGVGGLEDALAVFAGEDGGALGGRLDAGDVDGDGLDEVLAGDAASGRAWVLPLAAGEQGVDGALATLTGELSAGTSLAVLADADGDGRAEVALGAPDSGDGEAWLWLGPEGALGVEDAWLRLSGGEGAQLGAALVAWSAGLVVGQPGAREGAGQITWMGSGR